MIEVILPGNESEDYRQTLQGNLTKSKKKTRGECLELF
jgi:hypothetical protein